MATNNNTNGPLAQNGLTASGRNISTIAIAKGDLIVGTGVNTSTVLPIGNPYQVIKANSATSTGLEYSNGITAANDNNRIFGYGNSASNYTIPTSYTPSVSTNAIVANALYFINFNIYKSTTFSEIGMNITSFAAASSVRMGIYDCNGNLGDPANLILDAGTLDSSTNGIKTIAISQTLYDKFWVCFICNGTPTIQAGTSNIYDVNGYSGLGSFNTSTSVAYTRRITGVPSYFTALPSSVLGLTSTNTVSALVFLRV